MKILIIKLSSIGDVVHTLPAITDFSRRHSDVVFDWVVDSSIVNIPRWHPKVGKIIPCNLRKWKSGKIKAILNGEIISFINNLRETKYDLIIDAQGLLKSALIARIARSGVIHGFNNISARESAASLFYTDKHLVSKKLHAIERLRILFSKSTRSFNIRTNYQDNIDYGVNWNTFKINTTKYVLFLHGTSWSSKKWPKRYWQELIELLSSSDIDVKLTYSNQSEEVVAKQLALNNNNVELVPPVTINKAARLIANSSFVVTTDTGFGHIASAMGKKVCSIFGATDSNLTGMLGENVQNIQSRYKCSPCFYKKCKYNQNDPPCYLEINPKQVFRVIVRELELNYENKFRKIP